MVFEEGFYLLNNGKLIYLSKIEEKFIVESRTGSTCEVDEGNLKGWGARKIEPKVYFQDVENNKIFITSKLERLAQSKEHPFREWAKEPLAFP